ncbi:MAG TPA: pantoate--beta-alanine ligase [Longimicrobiales bacterium]|nr:pantoate--beta-alanine ligase [Longimicrobiales bacterium]
MITAPTIAAVRAAVAEARRGGARVALVPTMGYLHEGHLSLVDEARRRGDLVVMSIFVNPLQFGVGEDLDRYPRDLERDAALAADRGVDVLFVPARDEMYPAGEPVVRVVPGRLADRLDGAARPGHFEGVLTVVAKLLNIVQPDLAIFGQKDFQQSVLVRRMVADLDVPVEIVVAPIVREPDGLALSSRNVYLGAAERASARALSRALGAAEAAARAGERDAARLLAAMRAVLDAEPGVRPQYVELVDPETLEPVATAVAGTVAAVAAFVGPTRLIDNLVLP